MITQVCNLSCRGCTNYSDLAHTGYVPWSQGQAWLQQWNQRLVIEDFGIMGGEPLINPEVRSWLVGVRDLLPDSQIRFTTNGLLLHRYPDLLDLCQELGNVVFKITVHVRDPALEEEINRIMSARTWHPVTEHGIKRWRSTNGLRFQVNRPDWFLSPFRNDYSDMAPWNSDPVAAFRNCIQQTCPLLYQGRIYKCSTAALLRDTLKRFGDPNITEWMRYINHGIGHHDDHATLADFIENFGKPNPMCSQCPDKTVKPLRHMEHVLHKKNGSVKHIQQIGQTEITEISHQPL